MDGDPGEIFVLGYSRWQLFKGLAAAVAIASIVSLVLIYFFHVELELRATAGAVENVKLLQDPKSGVQIALVNGGVSDGNHAPGLLSLGTVYNQPFWIFYASNEPFERMSQLKGKRIAVGPIGSGTRASAEQI